MRGTWSQDARVSSRQMAWKSGERCEASADLPSINPGHTCDPSASVCNQLHSRCRFSCFFSSSAAEITRGHRQHGCRDETHVTLPVLGMERKSVAAICLTLALPRAAQDAAPSASLPVCLCLCDCLCVCVFGKATEQAITRSSRISSARFLSFPSCQRQPQPLSIPLSLSHAHNARLSPDPERAGAKRATEREREESESRRADLSVRGSGETTDPLKLSLTHSFFSSLTFTFASVEAATVSERCSSSLLPLFSFA